jgi:hypothetical protein
MLNAGRFMDPDGTAYTHCRRFSSSQHHGSEMPVSKLTELEA